MAEVIKLRLEMDDDAAAAAAAAATAADDESGDAVDAVVDKTVAAPAAEEAEGIKGDDG
jgi:hypothetical protein